MKTTLTLTLLMLLQFSFAQNAEKLFSASIESSENSAKVWETISNINLWKKWDETVVDSKFDGDMQQKSRGVFIRPSGIITEFKVVNLDPGKTYTFSHKVSSGILFTKRSVEEVGSGSKITEEVWFKGISKKTFQKYYGTDFENVQQTRLQSLKKLMEGA